jgi:antitoxin MazE
MNTIIQKWGNSAGVRISVELMKKAKLKHGDMVKIVPSKDGIEIKKINKLNLEALCAQITPENTHEEIDWGKLVGKEVW